jgi:group I intron endonuclease
MEHLHPSGVYMIRNKLNRRKYIGSSVNLKYRLFQHKWYLEKGNHQNSRLQKAWNKFKQRYFEFKILFYCAENDLLFFEQRCLDRFKKLYNICKCANDTSGRKCSSETKKKISNSIKVYNKKNGHVRLGKHHTEVTKKKLSNIRKEFYKTEAGDRARQAVIASNKRRARKQGGKR